MENWNQTDEPLLRLVSAGHETWTAASGYGSDCCCRLPPRRVVLQLTLAGAAFHARDGRRSLVVPGQAFIDILPGPWSYGVAAESPVPYEQVFAAFTGPEAFDLAGRIIGRFGNVVEVGESSPLVAPMAELAALYVHGRTIDRYLVSARLYELCMILLSQLGRRRTRACPVVSAALEAVTARYADSAFNVDSLVRLLRCSRSHIGRRFNDALAVTPLQYLTQYRLDRARQMLHNTDRPIREVAAACGFASDNYFCRLFRSRYCVTPLEDRRSARS